MKKFIAAFLALIMCLSMAACGADEPTIKDAIKEIKMEHKLSQAEDAQVEAPVEEPPMEESEIITGEQSYTIDDFYGDSVHSISFTLPESMWFVDNGGHTLYIYNVESLDAAHSASPRIQFDIIEPDKIDSEMQYATELEDLEPRAIGGIEMQGRYYKMYGMYWTEYYGLLPDGYWMSVSISKLSVDPNSDGSNILDSVIFD